MRDETIENCFNLGLTAPEIALFLVSVNGIGISLRQYWKKEYSDGWDVQVVGVEVTWMRL